MTRRRLVEMCRMYSPGFMFLSETKKDKMYLQDLQVEVGFDNLQTVEPEGNSGGVSFILFQ